MLRSQIARRAQREKGAKAAEVVRPNKIQSQWCAPPGPLPFLPNRVFDGARQACLQPTVIIVYLDVVRFNQRLVFSTRRFPLIIQGGSCFL
jgi:hypothetical protein